MAYQYDFLQDSFKEAPFTVYQNAPTIQLPLMDSPLDISDWAVGVTPSGIPIAKDVNNPVVQEPTTESFEIKPPEAQISSSTSVSTSTYSKDYKKDYNKKNALYVMDRLVGKGFSPHVAAGIVGNLIVESGLNPKAYNGKDLGQVSAGMAQWGGGNFVRLQNFARNRNKHWQDLDTQIDFLLQSIDNDTMQGLQKARNQHEASEAWAYYERYSGYNNKLSSARKLQRSKGWTDEQTKKHIQQEHEKRSFFSNQIYNLWKNR